MNIPLKENERLDDLQNGYHIIQNTRDFVMVSMRCCCLTLPG